MEQFIFPRPAVAGELQNFVEARLHSDATDEVLRKRIHELIDTVAKSAAQPIYVAIDPATGEELGRFEGATLKDPQPFIDFLRTAQRSAGRVAGL